MRYLESRELLEKLINEADFLNAYSADHADFFYRLDPEDPIEDILEYWEWMIEPSYDNTSGLIEFQVEAFTREDALKVANLVVKYSQELVNELSDQARRDAVAFSKEEVAKAELRLKFIRNKLREFRSETKAVDPESSAGAQVSLTTELEQQLISLNARLTAARNGQLDEDSPTVRELKRQIKALEEQLVLKKAEIESSGSGASLSEILSDFERLQVDLEFAQQAYTAAMSSLERSRIDADRQQRFLAVYQKPSLAQDAIYPTRILNSILVFVICLMLWSIGLLLVNSVRDHIR
jgi:capsular polysaccharide transport system permease protein